MEIRESKVCCCATCATLRTYQKKAELVSGSYVYQKYYNCEEWNKKTLDPIKYICDNWKGKV
jgi:hypothetical protein